MIFYTSGIRGMIAIEEKVTIPSSNGVLEVVRERSVGVLTKVLLKDMNSVVSGVKRFADINGGVVKTDELENIAHSRGKVL